MKKALLILLAIGSFAACKKSEVTSVVSPRGIMGKWELHSRAGATIYSDTTYQPGNGNILQFIPDSTYKSYIKGTLSRSGIFHTRNHFSASASAIRYDELYFDHNTSYSLVNVSGVLSIKSFTPEFEFTEYDKIPN